MHKVRYANMASSITRTVYANPPSAVSGSHTKPLNGDILEANNRKDKSDPVAYTASNCKQSFMDGNTGA